MARKRIRATHRLRRPHGVVFDPARHFLKGMTAGERCTLPAGTHVIPRERELENMPDRFQALRVAGRPAERVIDDGVSDNDEPKGKDESTEDESTETTEDDLTEGEATEDETTDDETTEEEADQADPRAAVDEALAAVGGDWDALTSEVLQELAETYGITDIEGSGASGNVVKADYLRVVQGEHGVVD